MGFYTKNNMATGLNSLPPPPKNQTGMTLDQFQHLPPPPKGQTGVTLDQIQGQKPAQAPKLGQGGAGEFAGNALRAITSPLVRTGGLIESGLDQTLGRVGNAISGHGFTPTTTGQQAQATANQIDAGADQTGIGGLGTAVGTIAPYLVPGLGEESGAAEGAGVLAKAGQYALKQAPAIAANTAIGTAQTGDLGKGLEIGATQGLLKGAGDAISPLLTKLPTRIAQKALAGTNPETADYALKTAKLGSINQLLDHSKQATASGAKQIEATLSHPDHLGKAIDGSSVFERVMNGNPTIPQSGLKGSDMTQSQLAQKVRQLLPNDGKLITQLFSGKGLSLGDANALRQKLDAVSKAVYINGAKVDAPAVAASKQLGAEVASAIRENVKTQAPETVPMFEALQQEINLRNALGKAKGKLDRRSPIGLYDILSGVGGFAHSGPIGAIGTIAAEKAARSPGVQLGVAKIAQKVGPAISKTAAGIAKTAVPLAVKSQSGQ